MAFHRKFNEGLQNLIVAHLIFTKTRDDVLSIRDSGLSGISDDEVYEKACKGNMVIITMDKDFTRIFRFPPEKCGGIVVAKIYKRTLDETLAIFKKCIKQWTSNWRPCRVQSCGRCLILQKTRWVEDVLF